MFLIDLIFEFFAKRRGYVPKENTMALDNVALTLSRVEQMAATAKSQNRALDAFTLQAIFADAKMQNIPIPFFQQARDEHARCLTKASANRAGVPGAEEMLANEIRELEEAQEILRRATAEQLQRMEAAKEDAREKTRNLIRRFEEVAGQADARAATIAALLELLGENTAPTVVLPDEAEQSQVATS